MVHLNFDDRAPVEVGVLSLHKSETYHNLCTQFIGNLTDCFTFEYTRIGGGSSVKKICFKTLVV